MQENEKKKKKTKMSTRVLCVHVLFLMFDAPISDKLCEGEEIGKHGRIEKLKHTEKREWKVDM